MLHFPTITHSVVVRIWIVHVGTVLSLLKLVRQTIAIGVEACFNEDGFAPDILFNGALISTDFLAGLEKPGYTYEKRPENECGNDCYIRHLVVI